MSEEVRKYSVDSEDVFEHIVKEDKFELNHVVIKPQFTFPTHPTDADVIITVTKGELTVVLRDEKPVAYKAGDVLLVDRDTMSTLGNNGSEPCEVFVVKRR